MIVQDDFPLSPDCWADPTAYYEAFKKARAFFDATPAKSRPANEERSLYELTTHLYSASSNTDALFRTGLSGAEPVTAVWLSRARTLAEWFTATNDVPKFRKLSANKLSEIAQLSGKGELNKISETLYNLGIVLIHERSIPGAKVDGATFKLNSGTPVISLSLRYARLDYYWFTLLHELSHVALHYDILSTPIIDDLDEQSATLVEKQADKLAQDSLIPRSAWRACPAKYSLKAKDVIEFADKLNIAPQIVAGRLRRELRRYEIFSDIINSVNVREVLLGKD